MSDDTVVTVSRKNLERSSRLISWMAGYIGNMAPGRYTECFQELNTHFIAMGRLGVSTDDPSKKAD